MPDTEENVVDRMYEVLGCAQSSAELGLAMKGGGKHETPPISSFCGTALLFSFPKDCFAYGTNISIRKKFSTLFFVGGGNGRIGVNVPDMFEYLLLKL